MGNIAPRKPEKIAEAIKLRMEGWSIKEIANTLHVSKGSVSLWVRGLRENNVQEFETVYCKKCGKPIPKSIYIDGKRHRVNNRNVRKYCLECSPFDGGNRANLAKYEPDTDGKRKCVICERTLPIKEFRPSGSGRYRRDCRECYNKTIVMLRAENKRRAVEYLGGECQECGYHKNWAAMEFHHRESDKKETLISILIGWGWSERLVRELDKCDLVCSNCHREIHHPDCIL